MVVDSDIHPFEVFWDDESEEYYIFAPDGCVLVGGKAVTIKDSSDGNVKLESLGTELYGHVVKNSSSGALEVTFSGCAKAEGSKYNFRVASYGSADNDGEQYEIATSVVSFSEGASPSVFEFDGATKTVAASSFYIDGREASVAEGVGIGGVGDESVYLVCTATGCSDPGDESVLDPTTLVWTYELATEPASESTEGGLGIVCNIKLYDFVDGEIINDYRGANLPVISPVLAAARKKVFTFNDVDIAHIDASADIDIGVPVISGGKYIEVDASDPMHLVINYTGCGGGSSVSGYTSGPEGDVFVADIKYENQKLYAKYATMRFADGLCESIDYTGHGSSSDGWVEITEAVEETIYQHPTIEGRNGIGVDISQDGKIVISYTGSQEGSSAGGAS